MELIKLNSQIPIKSIPDEELNRIILGDFLDWISALLSLNGEKSSRTLETALPAVKDHCWSMGFAEIKKMFEMYADNKLSIEPIPNYFDRVLFGKIVQAYKDQKHIVKNKIEPFNPSDDDKLKTTCDNLMMYWSEFLDKKQLSNGAFTVFDRLVEKKIFGNPRSDLYKNYYIKKVKQAQEELREELKSKGGLLSDDFKIAMSKIRNSETSVVQCRAKCIVVEDYFKKLVNKNIDFKCIIKDKFKK